MKKLAGVILALGIVSLTVLSANAQSGCPMTRSSAPCPMTQKQTCPMPCPEPKQVCPAPCPTPCPPACPTPCPSASKQVCPTPCPTEPQCPSQVQPNPDMGSVNCGPAIANSQNNSIMSNLDADGNFKTFTALLRKTGMDKALELDNSACPRGKYTVFAPTDAAFEKVPPATVARLMKPENERELTQLVKHHIVRGEYDSTDLAKLNKTKSLDGYCVSLGENKCGLRTVDNSKVVCSSIVSKNGVIHKVDEVLVSRSR